MKKTQIICLALVLSLLIPLSGCSSKENAGDSTSDTTEIGFYTTDEECYTIETKYGKLEYPKKWKEITKTKIEDGEVYSVKFFCVTSAGDVPLFVMSFNGGEGFLLGSLPVDGENIPVYLDSFKIDQSSISEEEYNNCCTMEEDVNVIISRLIEKNGFILPDSNTPAKPVEEDTAVYTIETKYGNLSYPEKWKELANIEIAEEGIYTVKFSTATSAGEVPLFDLTFNGGEGYCLGTMKSGGQDVTIYIDDYTFDQSTLSEDEYFNCCAMQEDVNVILEHLAEDYGFSFN